MKKTTTFLTITLLIITINLEAQFNPLWNGYFQHTTAQNYSNESRKIVQDASGNVFVLADVTSNLDLSGNISATTYNYVVLLKYNDSGSLLNEVNIDVINHTVSGNNASSAFGLEIDQLGNIYVGYNYFDANTGSDIRLSKYDNNLVELWTQKYNPSTSDFGIKMKIDQTGVVFMVIKTVIGGNFEYVLLKSDDVTLALGSLFSFNVNDDVINDLVIDGNSNVFITGFTMVSGFKNALTAGVSSTGTLLWKSIYNGSSASRDDFGKSITLGIDGNLYIIGTSDRGGANSNDVMIFKAYPGNGKKYWVSFQHLNAFDQGFFIDANTPNYVYTGSVSNATVVISMLSAADGSRKNRGLYVPLPQTQPSTISTMDMTGFEVSPNDIFYVTGNIIATDNNGDTFNSAYLAAYSLEPRGRGGFKLEFENSVDGEFNENFSSTGILLDIPNDDVLWLRDVYYTYVSHSTEIILLTDFEVPAPLRETSSSLLYAGDVSLQPNPASNFINLISNEPILKIEWFDVAGKLILTSEESELNIQVDISELSPGVYMCKTYTASGHSNFTKVVKSE